MTTLTRNATLSFSRRYGYEPLGPQGKETMLKSFSYRRRRAKQRKVFLTTYKLASIESFAEPKSPKLNKVAVKVKKIVASVLMFIQIGSFRSCNTKSAIATASPVSNRKGF